MKKLFIILIIGLIFSGCETSKRITSYRDVKRQIKRTEQNEFEKKTDLRNAKMFFKK